MIILDCTLRDGGYYNNWDFEPHVVQEYLSSVAKAKIDYVELGLRCFPKPGFLGAYAYTTEEHLSLLDLPSGPKYGVMVDAKTILSADFPIEEAVEKLFVPASQSKIEFVRIAAHFHEVEHSGPIVKKLKSMGYIVGYNLMQAGGKPASEISDKAAIASSWGLLDVLYFADSLGNMDGEEVKRIVNALKCDWSGPIGIHTHNNMGKGLDNTLTANSVGVEWLDTTITGMGRGAGNTPTEYLLASLDSSRTVSRYNSKPIYELVVRHFETMQREFGWGANLLYFLGAQNNIHPTYIQNLLSNSHYGTDEVVGAIDYLSQLDGTTSYNGSVLDAALTFSSKDLANSESYQCDIKNIFSNREVLILANGASTEKYSDAICQYIKHRKPIVLSVNIIENIPDSLVDYYVISHNSKFLADVDKYRSVKRPLILPKHRFSIEELALFQNARTLNYGFEVKKQNFSLDDEKVITPYDITALYALAIARVSNAERIALAGFDGYEKGDKRQQEMLEILQFIKGFFESEQLYSITPTSYPVNQRSVYAIHL
ncbi:aldolase catalytic domain-containing protein [Shewanella cyperi]|uniref:Aldolase catalytic domain-containing protein n=1 Tax=Shewanella cyperi TaxID=2814292 RepID=A0A975AJ47_9GAMM|nr:aldolase catalytic domain-containing protein [Shewanella cyperi]QSX28917.1 aldolase catalytic domain-containing protein [Shewanella cyperi]